MKSAGELLPAIDDFDAAILRVLRSAGRRRLNQTEIAERSQLVHRPDGKPFFVCRRTIHRHLPALLRDGLVDKRGKTIAITPTGIHTLFEFDGCDVVLGASEGDRCDVRPFLASVSQLSHPERRRRE